MKSFKQFNEVAPPGWGHTKAEKEKTDPSKPKSKIGGTIAAMKRAQDRGDIDKNLNIFALAYSMKEKGYKPHYKPGTDKKYKKYQEESLSVKDTKKLAKASALSHSDDPKDQDRARARQVEIDYKDLMRQRKKREKKKAIDAIPDKSSEVYNRNLLHKSPTDPRESVELLGADGKVAHEIVDIIKPEPMKVPQSSVKWEELIEVRKLPNYNKTGNIIDVYLAWRGRNYMIQMFFPQVTKPSRKDVMDQLYKVYPGSTIHSYQVGTYNPGEPILQIN